jgi:beta-glucosidase/6-phospho-beta-glucosidase/beta-galactosidase
MKEIVYNKSISQGFVVSRLPEFTKEEIKYIRGSADILGINHYTTSMMRPRKPNDHGVYPTFEQIDEIDVILYDDPSWSAGIQTVTKIVPSGFTKMLSWVRVNYKNPKVMILENGFQDYGGLNDVNRVWYMREYLNALLDAIQEGSKVLAYTAWSLMDNFEWSEGFRYVRNDEITHT